MIGIVEVQHSAHRPNMPLEPLFAFTNSPSSVRVRNVPRQIGAWKITKVYVTAMYPDNTSRSAQCELVGGVWVGTIRGSSVSGRSEQGFRITADGVDENGGTVTGYVLGVGDVVVIDYDGSITPGSDKSVVHWVTSTDDPVVGDVVYRDGRVMFYDGTQWITDTCNIVESLSNPGYAANADNAGYASYSGSATTSDESNQIVNDDHTQYINGDGEVYRLFDGWSFSDGVAHNIRIRGNEDDGFGWYDDDEEEYSNEGRYAYATRAEAEAATELHWDNYTATRTSGWRKADDLALSSQVPSKTSDLTNDSGYITDASLDPIRSDINDKANATDNSRYKLWSMGDKHFVESTNGKKWTLNTLSNWTWTWSDGVSRLDPHLIWDGDRGSYRWFSQD